MSIYGDKAAFYFRSGYNCAQAVYAAFADRMNISEKDALRRVSGLGGGIGRMREVCGAVSAAALVLSELYGYTDARDDDAKKELYAHIQEVSAQFKAEYSTIICRELLCLKKNDITPKPTPRSAAFYKERPCLGFVVSAAEILAGYLDKM